MERNIKLKIYLKDGTFFWAKIYKDNIKAEFNEDIFDLLELNVNQLVFQSSSTENILSFDISEKSWQDITYIQKNKL